MNSKSLSRRCRQKAVLPPTFRVENELNQEAVPQHFQVLVNIIEARKLNWSNTHTTSSYVAVSIDKKKFKSNIKRNASEPFYNQCFVHDLYTSIQNLERSNIGLAVMEPRCCAPARLIGESTIALGLVWDQLYHQIIHKWVQLTLPRSPGAGSAGFLKIDVSISLRDDVNLMPTILNVSSQDTIENNLLFNGASEQQRANYLITVYGVFGLHSGGNCYGNRRKLKPPSSFVKVTFCGLVAKTAVQHRSNNPMYCEQISMVEMFPNFCQTIRLDVCSTEGRFNKVLGNAQLKIPLISHDGENGFVPTFGPSLLHMYGSNNMNNSGSSVDDEPYHQGALLVSLRTIVPYYQQILRNCSTEPVKQIKPEHIWNIEDFVVLCPILEVSMLDRKIFGKNCGVALTIAELTFEESEDEESRKLHYTGSLDIVKMKQPYGYIDFCKGYPVLQLACRLPDFRFCMFRNNMIYKIVTDLDMAVNDVENRLKAQNFIKLRDLIEELDISLEAASTSIVKFLEILRYSVISVNSESIMGLNATELDQRQMALQKEEMEKINMQILRRKRYDSSFNINGLGDGNNDTTKKEVKLLFAEIKAVIQELRSLIFKSTEGWPDIVIWLLHNGSRVAYARIPISDVIYSSIAEQSGKQCGGIQTIFAKPIKCLKHSANIAPGCYCIAAKIEVLLWMGLYKEISNFAEYLPEAMNLKPKGCEIMLRGQLMVLLCRVFIHKAKINATDCNANISYVFVRVNVLNAVQETKVKPKAAPIWNQVLKIQKILISSTDRINKSPPSAIVELYGNELADKLVLIGCFIMNPKIEDRTSVEYVPKLEWHNVYKGSECMGQILISAQISQVPEKILKTVEYTSVEEGFYENNIACDISKDETETLPPGLIPLSTSYKIDVYWWGLRGVNIMKKPCVVLEINDLTIKSEVIADKRVNCNFPNGRCSHAFVALLGDTNSSQLNIKLYDSGTFGRSIFFGTNAVKKLNKYVVDWLPKEEREASLKSASIMSSNFCQVSNGAYVKKTNHSIGSNEYLGSTRSLNSNHMHCESNKSSWNKIFRRTTPTEEETVLLPMFAKINDSQIKAVDKITKQRNLEDWWQRYFKSLKDYDDGDTSSVTDKITIYDSELEMQPEFSKFKDWCASLKLYNGYKTGLPDKDDHLFVGILKVGIAIYKWPPPTNTIAVSFSGVHLNNGYFDDFPSNQSVQYLVRVYLVKGIDLKKKDFTGRISPYVILNYGKKKVGDRNASGRNDADPIFGRMYELRCYFPDDYLLRISLYDQDSLQTDELIGTTAIDLEDRVYTKHRACISLSSQYNTTGPFRWRDHMKPSEILEELCAKNHLPPPIYSETASVIVNGIEYRDNNFKDHMCSSQSSSDRKECICLSLLHQWHTLPLCGYKLVPEHVETRSLYNPEKPGVEQGKIQLWIDLMPLDTEHTIPPPLDITPRSPKDYELRLIIWDVKHLRFNESAIGKKCPDIFIRAWVGNASQAQDTDIHCQCVNKEANFNWRMIFDFRYQHVEKKIVVKEKGPFIEYEQRVSPILVIQVMDSDAVSQDDCIGTLSLNMSALQRGEISIRNCTLKTMDQAKRVNLFDSRSIRGWWPLWTSDLQIEKKIVAGVIDMELTLLPKEKAILMPAGLGRSCPNALPSPIRNSEKNTYFQLKPEDMCPPQSFKVLFLVLVLLSLTLFTIYIDGFSVFETTDWITGDSSFNNNNLDRFGRSLYPL